MEFDQNLFLYFYNFNKRRKDAQLLKIKNEKEAVDLSSVLDSLCVFSSAVFKQVMEIRPSDDYPYLSGRKLFLPKYISTEQGSDLNYLFYKILILHLYAIRQTLDENTWSKDIESDQAIIDQLKPGSIKFLREQFPSYDDMMKTLTQSWADEDFQKKNEQEKKQRIPTGLDRKILWGRLPQKTSIIAADDTTPVMREALPDGGTEKENKNSKRINKVNFEEDKENIGQDVFHHFEKVETLEEYKGIQRDADGADELDSHATALDELNLEEVTRSSKGTQSIYKTDLDMGFEVSDLSPGTPVEIVSVYKYDEWDEKKHQYKKDWCQVMHEKIEMLPQKVERIKSHLDCLKERHYEIERIKKKLVQLSSEVYIKKKLYTGRQIDIDHYIRNQSLIRAQISGDGRYYQEVEKKHRDMCVLLLVDSSLSSDSWIQNKRILDISLEALLVFGEAAGMLGDPVMVAGFNSNTRNACRFLEWKTFDQDWSVFKRKVDDIVPEGYTRIGPAIRHATHLLEQRKEKHKVLLLITDGRPTDYDRYEGSYGLSDVRKAIQESELAGVTTFALAVDPTAKQFLPKLFGHGNFQILMNIQKLPEILSQLYVKLAKGK